MMIFIAVCVLFIHSSTVAEEYNATDSHQFMTYMKKYGKGYLGVELQKRSEIFRRNVLKIEEHNVMYHANKSSYYLGINQFTDMTQSEFESLLTYVPRNDSSVSMDSNLSHKMSGSVDWRDQGKVTPVKDQGQCGSCWTFGSIAAIETRYAIKYNKLLSFSEQQVVDCDKNCWGCGGGFVSSVFGYGQVQGLCTSEDYPVRYQARESSCHANQCMPSVKLTAYVKLATYSRYGPSCVGSFLNALDQGTISISINANRMNLYRGGVYDDTSCPHSRNHAVSIVGYGSDEYGRDYYIVRNSWGSTWGENGYMRIRRGRNICDMENDGLYPKIQ